MATNATSYEAATKLLRALSDVAESECSKFEFFILVTVFTQMIYKQKETLDVVYVLILGTYEYIRLNTS